MLALVLWSGQTLAFTSLNNRVLDISTAVGGATASHSFSFEFPVAVTVGSLKFEYCDDPIEEVACVNPTGSDVSAAVLVSEAGETGFSIASQDANHIILGRSAAAVGAQTNTYRFTGITNPSNKGPFFVRISAYASSDATGPMLSYGAVAGSINQSININAEVPDILNFCVAIAIPTDCSDATGNFIDFGILRPSATSYGTSQFMVGTNAVNGYTVTVNGPTMTSGFRTIPGINSPDISRLNTSQFGINLTANLNPVVGSDPIGGTGSAMPNYAISDHYTYHDGDVVAAGSTRSENELYTVSYIVNINTGQHAGIYNTTIEYVCTAGF